MALIQIEAHITIAQILLAAVQFPEKELDELLLCLLELRVERFGPLPALVFESKFRPFLQPSGHLAEASQGWEEEADALANVLDQVVAERYPAAS
ncbi:MAG: hypothetical protein HC824_18060 [Synechococcales cyanobacterium RM1_1_8]|nr:hypothetical protein [Synechococcales cyanobacterium RM1_1_8]